ncbi:MAG: lysozyme inhibitor LprI family protein [Bacteroidota bacterium]
MGIKSTLKTLIITVSLGAACTNNSYESHCAELDAIDLEMLQVHEKIKSKYSGDERFLQRLQDAQVYWIQYKDRHIRALYPLEKKNYKEKYGKTYNQCKCKEAARLTYLRVEELKIWLDGPIDPECPTSIK